MKDVGMQALVFVVAFSLLFVVGNTISGNSIVDWIFGGGQDDEVFIEEEVSLSIDSSLEEDFDITCVSNVLGETPIGSGDCAVFDENGKLTIELTAEEENLLRLRCSFKTPGPEFKKSAKPNIGDCGIYSFARYNAEVLPQHSLQVWYQLIRYCAISKGYYNPKTGSLRVSNIWPLLRDCKFPLTSSLGYEEQFDTFDNAKDRLLCPPFRDGDLLHLIISSPSGDRGHAVTCTVNDCSAGKLTCHDRSHRKDLFPSKADEVEGVVIPKDYEVTVSKDGKLSIGKESGFGSMDGWKIDQIRRGVVFKK